ncbi:hypothetical protein [Anaerosalibacter massiliensis]|uniref:Uncharacterized protein n=1 Tax=Anaerosalibacter massiliensis TaxID=1347392 RepID=A0A9X2S430_9FIRM|nr:hypothetical protein [Anaerosalibacter massiliensis]MCR2042854.1 hypothetical protein [Anaerosalibacter massiliensis]
MEEKNKIEEGLDDILSDENSRLYNFMINASNQANLTNNNNISPIQLNSIFVILNPYYIDKFNIEGLDLDLKIDEKGILTINNKRFELIEIEPGVKIFGISKESKE